MMKIISNLQYNLHNRWDHDQKSEMERANTLGGVIHTNSLPAPLMLNNHVVQSEASNWPGINYHIRILENALSLMLGRLPFLPQVVI